MKISKFLPFSDVFSTFIPIFPPSPMKWNSIHMASSASLNESIQLCLSVSSLVYVFYRTILGNSFHHLWLLSMHILKHILEIFHRISVTRYVYVNAYACLFICMYACMYYETLCHIYVWHKDKCVSVVDKCVQMQYEHTVSCSLSYLPMLFPWD